MCHMPDKVEVGWHVEKEDRMEQALEQGVEQTELHC